MTPNEKALKLIAIYLYISKLYEYQLIYHCQRYSNNANPKCTDVEILTMYLFVVSEQRGCLVKEIYSFIKDYWLSWFPTLPSYQAFNNRLNGLACVWPIIFKDLLENYAPANCNPDVSLIDSFPIVTCKGRNRKGKVAREIADKGYCSTKNMHYYGLKLHNLGFRRKGTIPFPEMMTLSAASENDYKVFVREFDPYLNNRTVFADKSYVDDEFFSNREMSQNYQVLTPCQTCKRRSRMYPSKRKSC
jgi:hypothetical protein